LAQQSTTGSNWTFAKNLTQTAFQIPTKLSEGSSSTVVESTLNLLIGSLNAKDSEPRSIVDLGRIWIPRKSSLLEVRIIEDTEKVGETVGIVGCAREVFSLKCSKIFATKRELVMKALIHTCPAYSLHTDPHRFQFKVTKPLYYRNRIKWLYSGSLGKVCGDTFLLEFLDVLCAEISLIGDHRTILTIHDFYNHVATGMPTFTRQVTIVCMKSCWVI